jgi:hypothetical protein
MKARRRTSLWLIVKQVKQVKQVNVFFFDMKARRRTSLSLIIKQVKQVKKKNSHLQHESEEEGVSEVLSLLALLVQKYLLH